jgi:hypothetical protein
MCLYKCMLNVYKTATVDGRDLIFGRKLHIGTPYRGKHFWTHQIPTSCLSTLLIFRHIEHTFCNVYKNQLSRQTGSRNLTDPKMLPTIWHTYMKLVTKYQIPVINSRLYNYTPVPRRGIYCFTSVRLSFHPSFRLFKIFFVAFFSVTVDDIWSPASYRYTILNRK